MEYGFKSFEGFDLSNPKHRILLDLAFIISRAKAFEEKKEERRKSLSEEIERKFLERGIA